jgi:two-component system sensor histidine kinase KdpD
VERIFDLFHRTPTAKPGGMGLAIMKGFVETQGDRVRAANRPDGGVRFEIRLPTGEAPLCPDESP